MIITIGSSLLLVGTIFFAERNIFKTALKINLFKVTFEPTAFFNTTVKI